MVREAAASRPDGRGARARDRGDHGRGSGGRDLDRARLDPDAEAVALMQERGTWLVPTLYLRDAIPRDKLPPPIRAKMDWVTPLHGLELPARAPGGVRIAFGTDASVYPHGQNAREFAVHVRLGQTPLEAIRGATLYAVRVLGVDDRGVIAAGKLADLVAVPRRSAARHLGAGALGLRDEGRRDAGPRARAADRSRRGARGADGGRRAGRAGEPGGRRGGQRADRRGRPIRRAERRGDDRPGRPHAAAGTDRRAHAPHFRHRRGLGAPLGAGDTGRLGAPRRPQRGEDAPGRLHDRAQPRRYGVQRHRARAGHRRGSGPRAAHDLRGPLDRHHRRPLRRDGVGAGRAADVARGGRRRRPGADPSRPCARR